MPVTVPHRGLRRRAAGFSLVEVLVAVTVLSIGLLGVGKMVLYSARSNGSAYMRSEATTQAYAIIDTMHANRTAAASHGYDVALGVVPAATQNCYSAGPCTTATAIASYDLSQWKAQVAAVLPAGDGSVVTATDPTTQQVLVTVTVQWDDTVAQGTFAKGAATTMSVVLESQL